MMTQQRYVDIDWLRSHLKDDSVRLIDVRAVIPAFGVGYPLGHIPGAVGFDTAELFAGREGIPGKLVDASMFIFEGQVTVYDPKHDGPCYRCLYPDPPPPGEVPTCAEAGILGVLPGIVGSLQAVEAIKLILGIGEPLIGRMLLFDALSMTFRELRIERDSECPVSGDDPTLHELIDYQQFCGLPSSNSHESLPVARVAGD